MYAYEHKFDKYKATVDNAYQKLKIMLLVRKPTTTAVELNGEIKSNTTRGLQVLDGVIQMISLGRLSLGKIAFKDFAKWELADAIVTEATHVGSLAGFSQEQNANLGYYVLKAVYQQKTGELEKIIDYLDAAKDMYLNKDQLIEKLGGIGIVVNSPADKDAAAKKAVDKIYKNKKG
jgi:hypothetical protein